jgi:hypothetical protein
VEGWETEANLSDGRSRNRRPSRTSQRTRRPKSLMQRIEVRGWASRPTCVYSRAHGNRNLIRYHVAINSPGHYISDVMDRIYCDECARIEDNATYSAEAHHILAKRQRLWFKLFQLIPAVATALIGTLTVGQVVPQWVGIIGLITAVVTAIGTVLNPQQDYYEHLSAAKSFTVIRHDARELRELSGQLANDEITVQVKCLHDRYNDLVRIAPPTEDWAFEKGKERIKAGVHSPDAKR